LHLRLTPPIGNFLVGWLSLFGAAKLTVSELLCASPFQGRQVSVVAGHAGWCFTTRVQTLLALQWESYHTSYTFFAWKKKVMLTIGMDYMYKFCHCQQIVNYQFEGTQFKSLLLSI
jgi:hypothetical protein